MLPQAFPQVREKGKIRKVTRDLNPNRLAVPKADATTPNHLVGRRELVLAKEKTSLLATEVGGRLESAITSKRVLVPKERTVTTYTNANNPGHPLPKVVARRVGNPCPFFAKGTCK